MKTVLIVDDEEGIADALAGVLEDEGYRAVTAMNGREALERIADRRPDLVVTDVMMPGLDGRALLERIRGEEALADLPVVLMTAAPGSLGDGMPRYEALVRKPFTLDMLLDVVRRLAPPA